MIEKIDTRDNKKRIDDIINRYTKNYHVQLAGAYNDPIRCFNVFYSVRTDAKDLRTEVLRIETDYAGRNLMIRVLDKSHESIADKIGSDYEAEFPKADITILI